MLNLTGYSLRNQPLLVREALPVTATEVNFDGRTYAYGYSGLDEPTVPFNDRSHNRQPKPAACGVFSFA